MTDPEQRRARIQVVNALRSSIQAAQKALKREERLLALESARLPAKHEGRGCTHQETPPGH